MQAVEAAVNPGGGFPVDAHDDRGGEADHFVEERQGLLGFRLGSRSSDTDVPAVGMTVHAHLRSIPFHALDGRAVGPGIGMVQIHTALERKGVDVNFGMAFNEVEQQPVLVHAIRTP